MRQWLKKYFVPHEENDHKPHILRSNTILFFALLTLGAEIFFFSQAFIVLPRGRFLALIFPNVLVDETNANRIAINEVPLTPSPLLIEAAQTKAHDMVTKGYFAHTSPEGYTPWYWYEQAGYHFSYAGENLAVDFIDSSDVTNAWMNSLGHRANILNAHFTNIGIAIASGTYEGHSAVFVVELFGRPASTYTPIAPIANAMASSPAHLIRKPALPSLAPPPVVLKEESSTHGGTQDLFVAVKSAEIGPGVSATGETLNTAPAATKSAPQAVQESNVLDRILASPRVVVDDVLALLAGIMLLGVVMSLYHRLHLSEPRLIFNGTFIILLVIGMFALNYYFSISYLKIL